MTKMRMIVESYEEGYQKNILHPEMIEERRRDADKIQVGLGVLMFVL